MITVYVEISKYLIVLLMAMYTFCNFRYFDWNESSLNKKVSGSNLIEITFV